MDILNKVQKVGQFLREKTTSLAIAATAALGLSAGAAAAAGSGYAICAENNATGEVRCGFDQQGLGRGQTINYAVDDQRVTVRISNNKHTVSNEANMDGISALYNMAYRAAEAIEERGYTVRMLDVRMGYIDLYQGEDMRFAGCDQWECLTATQGNEGYLQYRFTRFSTPNALIEGITGQEVGRARGEYPIVEVPAAFRLEARGWTPQ